jgi:hypothetical protein
MCVCVCVCVCVCTQHHNSLVVSSTTLLVHFLKRPIKKLSLSLQHSLLSPSPYLSLSNNNNNLSLHNIYLSLSIYLSIYREMDRDRKYREREYILLDVRAERRERRERRERERIYWTLKFALALTQTHRHTLVRASIVCLCAYATRDYCL